jgi:hypothetical protein
MRSDRQGTLRLVLQVPKCTENYDRDLIRDDGRQRLPLSNRSNHHLKTGFRILTAIKTRSCSNPRHCIDRLHGPLQLFG